MLRLLQEGQLKYVFAPIQLKQTHVPGPKTTKIYTRPKYKQLKYNPLKYRRKKHLFAHMLSVHVLQQMEQKKGFKKVKLCLAAAFSCKSGGAPHL